MSSILVTNDDGVHSPGCSRWCRRCALSARSWCWRRSATGARPAMPRRCTSRCALYRCDWPTVRRPIAAAAARRIAWPRRGRRAGRRPGSGRERHQQRLQSRHGYHLQRHSGLRHGGDDQGHARHCGEHGFLYRGRRLGSERLAASGRGCRSTGRRDSPAGIAGEDIAKRECTRVANRAGRARFASRAWAIATTRQAN